MVVASLTPLLVALWTIINSTVTNNFADGADSEGGGIYALSAAISITNSIVAGNMAGDGMPDIRVDPDDGFVFAEYSLIEQTGLDLQGGVGNIEGMSANLGPLADNGGMSQTHALLSGSPAIDAGDPSVAFDPIEFDQRGDPFARVADGGSSLRIDMGAYESQDEFLLGDANVNGVVDFSDIAAFIGILAADGFVDQADIDRNGFVTFDDIGPFIEILAAQ